MGPRRSLGLVASCVDPSTAKVRDAGVAEPFTRAGEAGPAGAGWRGRMRLPVELVVVFGVSKGHE